MYIPASKTHTCYRWTGDRNVIHIWTYTCVRVYMIVHIYIYICVRAYMIVYVYIDIRILFVSESTTHTCCRWTGDWNVIYIWTYTFVYVCTRLYTYTYTYVYVRTWLYMYTYIYAYCVYLNPRRIHAVGGQEIGTSATVDDFIRIFPRSLWVCRCIIEFVTFEFVTFRCLINFVTFRWPLMSRWWGYWHFASRWWLYTHLPA